MLIAGLVFTATILQCDTSRSDLPPGFELELTGTDGSVLRLSESSARPIAILFWSTDCPGCAGASEVGHEMLVESGRGSLFQINVDSGLSVQDLRSTADRFGIRGIGIYDPELRLVQALQISSHPALYVASPTRGVIVMHREYSLGAHARENARKALEAALNE